MAEEGLSGFYAEPRQLREDSALTTVLGLLHELAGVDDVRVAHPVEPAIAVAGWRAQCYTDPRLLSSLPSLFSSSSPVGALAIDERLPRGRGSFQNGLFFPRLTAGLGTVVLAGRELYRVGYMSPEGPIHLYQF